MAMLTVMLAVVVVGGVVAGCRDGGGRSHAARGGVALANWQAIFTLTKNRSAFQRTVNTLYKSGWVPGEFEYLYLSSSLSRKSLCCQLAPCVSIAF